MSITVELYGLELEGRHGVEEAERSRPQRFVYDLWLDVPDAAVSDRIEDTVDYREVVRCVRELSDSRQFHLLEAIAAAVADELLTRFALERVRVRVRKPDVALDAPVDWTGATVERPRP
jgi:7,8-dihydroneopterin aldolase/epimerase/oxygenase